MTKFERAIIVLILSFWMIIVSVMLYGMVKPTFDLGRIKQSVERAVNAQAQRQDQLQVKLEKVEVEIMKLSIEAGKEKEKQ